jgi:hypothetical protein
MHVLASHSCSDDANSTDSFESQSYQLAQHVFRFRALSKAVGRLQSWAAKKRVLRDVFDVWHHHTKLQLRLARATDTLQKANCQRAKVSVCLPDHSTFEAVHLRLPGKLDSRYIYCIAESLQSQARGLQALCDLAHRRKALRKALAAHNLHRLKICMQSWHSSSHQSR